MHLSPLHRASVGDGPVRHPSLTVHLAEYLGPANPTIKQLGPLTRPACARGRQPLPKKRSAAASGASATMGACPYRAYPRCTRELLDERMMSNRMLNWRILLAVLIAATLALAPALAEARAGSSAGGRSSSMGSRGSRTFENNGAQPLSRSVTPPPQPSRPPGFAPAAPAPAFGGGSFFQRHPFLTGLAGGFIGSWLFGHSGWAAGEDGGSGGSMLGMLLQLLIIGLLIYFAVRLFRGRSWATGGRGGWPPRSAGGAGGPAG